MERERCGRDVKRCSEEVTRDALPAFDRVYQPKSTSLERHGVIEGCSSSVLPTVFEQVYLGPRS